MLATIAPQKRNLQPTFLTCKSLCLPYLRQWRQRFSEEIAHSSDAPLKRVVVGRSIARPTPAISVDTNGDFADGKAEVSSSAMYIVRSFGDLTRADSIINCAGARLPMPSNPDEPPHQLRRTPVAVRIGRMQELAKMGYAIICKSCSNSTLNLQFGPLEARFPGIYRSEEEA